MEPFLTVREAAEALRLSRSRIYQLATAGLLPVHQIGQGKLLFRRSELEEALTKRAPSGTRVSAPSRF
jgi:excisionase family DNA binding protein